MRPIFRLSVLWFFVTVFLLLLSLLKGLEGLGTGTRVMTLVSVRSNAAVAFMHTNACLKMTKSYTAPPTLNVECFVFRKPSTILGTSSSHRCCSLPGRPDIIRFAFWERNICTIVVAHMVCMFVCELKGRRQRWRREQRDTTASMARQTEHNINHL